MKKLKHMLKRELEMTKENQVCENCGRTKLEHIWNPDIKCDSGFKSKNVKRKSD